MICTIHIRKGNTGIGFTSEQMLIDYVRTFFESKDINFDTAVSVLEKEGWNISYGKAD